MNTVGFDVFPESGKEWKHVEVSYRTPGAGSCVVIRLTGEGGDGATMNLFYGADDAGQEFLEKLKDAFAEASAPCWACGKEA